MYDGVRTIGAILEQRAAEQPDREIVRFAEGALTYAGLDDQANRIANAFAGLGLEPGDKVAVLLPNGPEFLAAWFGLARAGLDEVPLNVGLRGELLAYVLNQSECRAIVVADEWVPRVDAVAAKLQTLRHVIVVGEERACAVPSTPFGELLAAQATRPDVHVAPEDTSVLLFTSGTTGPSKAVVLSHNANFQLASSVIDVMEYAEDEVLFSAFPLFHVNAKYTSILVAMLLDRGTAVLHDRVLGVALLGHLPRRRRDRLQLHGRSAADVVQAARASGRRGQRRAQGVRGACAARHRAQLREPVRRRAVRGLRLDGGRHRDRQPPG